MEQIAITSLAKWFLSKEAMTHKKLQKICYYAVAWGWALMNKSIISDDRFEAWIHGPVAPNLYNVYRINGWNVIQQVANDQVDAIPSDMGELLESVWMTYGDKSGNELEALSHSEEPWIQARKGLSADKKSTEPIDPKIMKGFYNSIKTTDF